MDTETPTPEVELKDVLVQAESIGLRTVRLLINLVTNVLMSLTVFVCLVFACQSKIDVFYLHIILCVLGYQFFICQGILVLSPHNSWSSYLMKSHRRYIHISFQVIAVILVTAGSVLMMKEMPINFVTAHGCLGTLTLVLCLLGPISGIAFNFSSYLSNHINEVWLKYFHTFTGVAVLLLSAVTLCTGFNTWPFRTWIVNDDLVAILMSFTLLFSILVALDFWIVTVRRIKNRTLD